MSCSWCSPSATSVDTKGKTAAGKDKGQLTKGSNKKVKGWFYNLFTYYWINVFYQYGTEYRVVWFCTTTRLWSQQLSSKKYCSGYSLQHTCHDPISTAVLNLSEECEERADKNKNRFRNSKIVCFVKLNSDRYHSLFAVWCRISKTQAAESKNKVCLHFPKWNEIRITLIPKMARLYKLHHIKFEKRTKIFGTQWFLKAPPSLRRLRQKRKYGRYSVYSIRGFIASCAKKVWLPSRIDWQTNLDFIVDLLFSYFHLVYSSSSCMSFFLTLSLGIYVASYL